MNKSSKSQVIMKSDTTENWKRCEDKYIPYINTIIIYQDLNQPPRMKISDGVSLLKDLPFIEHSKAKETPVVDKGALIWN